MLIDHIYIFSENKGAESAELARLGLVPGSSRLHPGQGTTNAKFYFQNFFLEVLWVVDRQELESDRVKPTNLVGGADFRRTGYSRFGLCLDRMGGHPLFSESPQYFPTYFPSGMAIHFLDHSRQKTLPNTFKLPFEGKHPSETEPLNHPLGLEKLTRAVFGVDSRDMDAPLVGLSQQFDHLEFVESDRPNLQLEFDHARNGKSLWIESLDLTLCY